MNCLGRSYLYQYLFEQKGVKGVFVIIAVTENWPFSCCFLMRGYNCGWQWVTTHPLQKIRPLIIMLRLASAPTH